jgi:hypothetical protein
MCGLAVLADFLRKMIALLLLIFKPILN